MDFKVTIIIPVYNSIEQLINLCNQLLKDKPEEFELFFVDDCSEDNVYDYLYKYQAKDFAVFRSDKNEGSGISRNYGIKNAKGEFVYFLDVDDCFVGYDTLKKMYQKAKEKDVYICGGSIKIVDESGKAIKDIIEKEYFFHSEGLLNGSEYDFDYGYTRFIYKKSYLLDNNYFFPRYRRYQDPLFMNQVFSNCNKVYTIPEVTYIINRHIKKEWNSSEITDLSEALYNNILYSIEHKRTNSFRNNVRRVFADFGFAWTDNNIAYEEFINNIKKLVVLQNVIFLDKNGVQEEELFYHKELNGATGVFNKVLKISKGDIIDFNSYFNAFSCSKWKKYTDVHSVSLILKLKGTGKIELYHNKIMYGQVISHLINTFDFDVSKVQFVHFDFQELEAIGNFSFKILANSEVEIFDGFYINNYYRKKNFVNIAVVFTTYNRRDYIVENIRRLNLLQEEKVHTIIVDNAANLNIPSNDELTYLKNKNVGGAGGFARGMIELQAKSANYSHCILMDDDVKLDYRVIDRVSKFLSFLKLCYKNSMIGGAMLRSDLQYFLVESGAKYNGLNIMPFGYGKDMRNKFDCLYVDMPRNQDYNAWWFNVIPMTYIRKDNLPLPLFFQWDDIDYGIRNKSELILLNGICTWHDSFDSKKSALNTYYATRNSLIVNSCHSDLYSNTKSKGEIIKSLHDAFMLELCLYRYNRAEAIMKAIEDYLKGPKWLCELDAEKYNRSIQSLNIKSKCIDDIDYDWYQLCCNITDCDFIHKLLRIISLNGYLLPARKTLILPPYASRKEQGYRAKKIIYYDEILGTGYTCEKNIKKALFSLIRFYRVRRQFNRVYKKKNKEYKAAYPYMISNTQWFKYLNINN